MAIGGYTGRGLIINLSRKAYRKISWRDEFAKRYIGGKGFGVRLLYDLASPNIDPLSPKNPLILAAGPLNGTRVPLASKVGFFFKSPLTEGYGESYVGGSLPRYPKHIGYDYIVIIGKAQKPTYLVISEEGVEFRNAKELWGAGIIETDNTLRKEVSKNASVVAIGPAGENLVRFACIGVDKWRQAGRCGGGAVMGAKNLKAIVFTGGSEQTHISDEGKLNDVISQVSEKVRRLSSVKSMREYGTPLMAMIANEMGFFPTKYWSEGRYERWENIGPEAIRSKLIRPEPCWMCPIACGRYISFEWGGRRIEIDGPEYETVYALGGLLGVDSFDGLAYLNFLADDYGLDTISLGNVLGFVVEASKYGKISLKIDYGDVELFAELIRKIARRGGIGDILAEGVYRLSRKLGLEEIAVHVKGLEPPGYDPRVLKSMSIAYATSPRGACHLRAMAYIIDIRRLAGAPEELSDEKIHKIIEFENWMTAFDSLILCKFGRDIYSMELMLDAFNAVTGLDLPKKEFIGALERVVLLTRLFNQREGIVGDNLPSVFFRKTIRVGDREYRLAEEEFRSALRRYYDYRGLKENGEVPENVKKRLEEECMLRVENSW